MTEVPTLAWPGEVVPGNVVGVGIDLTNVAEVREAIRDFGQRFLNRIFTAHELAYCGRSLDPLPHLAARFAAKEATIKALRVDDWQPPWTSMEVRRHSSGWCQMCLSGSATELARQRQVRRLAVSLSHEGDIAAAIVIAHG
jgi:holo-[acyl-carrier protein] synthase